MSYFPMLNSGARGRLNPGRWLTIDLHVHSSYSGGSLSPAELLMGVGAQFLDAIGISDHYQIQGAIEGERFSAENPGCPLVIPAQEISLGDHFHILVVGTQKICENGHRDRLLEKIKAHHGGGGAIILAHPWTIPKASWATGCLQELLREKLIDGVEMFNASLLEFPEMEPLLKPVWENIVIPNELGITGGSDFHYHRQGRLLGTGRTYVKVDLPGITGIITALRNHQMVAGLFSYRPFDLGCFGSGYSVLLGKEPWYGELTGFINDLQNRVERLGKWNKDKQKALKRLMAGGYYECVWDLLEG